VVNIVTIGGVSGNIVGIRPEIAGIQVSGGECRDF
jgi:hypothetical protein